MSAILALDGLRQEDVKSEASLAYIGRPYLKATSTKKQNKIYVNK